MIFSNSLQRGSRIIYIRKTTPSARPMNGVGEKRGYECDKSRSTPPDNGHVAGD
jgi:hypothetical protein